MSPVRSFKTSAAVLLALVSLALAVAGWVFFTESGSRFTLNRVQSALSDFRFEFAGGSLATGVSLTNVYWRLKNNSTITSDEMTLTWDPLCWRGRTICLKETNAELISVNLERPRVIRNPVILKSISIPTEIKADLLKVKKLIINRPLNEPIILSDIEFSGDLHDTRINAEHINATWSELRATLSGRIDLESNYPLSARGGFEFIKSDNQIITGDITLTGDLSNTNVNANINRPFTSQLTGVVSPLNRLLPVDLTVVQSGFKIPLNTDQPLADLKNSRIRISGIRPDYDIQGEASFVRANDSNLSTATLSGTITTKKLSIDNLTLHTMDGKVTASGGVDYYQGIHWDAFIKVDSISPLLHQSTKLTNVSGNAKMRGKHEDGNCVVELTDINLNGHSDIHPFSLTGNVTRKPGKGWQFDNLAIDSSRNTINVIGNLSDESDLSVNFALREPGLLQHGLRGDIFGDFTIKGDQHSPDITGMARSRQLHINDLKLNDVRLQSQIKVGGNAPGKLVLNTADIRQNNLSLNETSLVLYGTRDKHSVSITLKSDPFSINSAIFSGSLDNEFNWNGEAQYVTGSAQGQQIRLIDAFPVTWKQEKKTLTLQPNCWRIGSASGCMDTPAQIGKNGSISIDLAGLDVEMLTPVYRDKIKATGALSANGRLEWSNFANPNISATANISDGSISTLLPSASKPVELDLHKATLNIFTRGQQLWSRLNLKTDKLGDIHASGMIEPGKSFSPIRGNFRLNSTPLHKLLEYYPQLKFQGGVISADIITKGTLRQPEFSGNITVADLDYSSEKLPMPLESINLVAEIENSSVTLNGFADSLGKRITISGEANEIRKHRQVKLHVSGNDLAFHHRYVRKAIISPDITLAMSPAQTIVTGTVKLKDAFIEIPKAHNTAVPLSRDVVVIDAAKGESGYLKNRLRQSISTDVNIQLGRDVYFSGYGIKAQLQGMTNVNLKPDRTPELLGVLNIKNGTYRSYGQALNIRNGRISFVGPLQQSTLSVEAVRDTGDVLAGIRIDGSLDKPETTLFSDPPMPEEHILPYVVLGRPLELNTNTDDSQMLANAALFMGISNGRNLTRSIASSIGIDNFSMHATGSGEDTQVQLSGLINDRLLVSYGLGVFNSVNTLFLRYSLAEKLYLETTQGLERAVDVFYSFEFD